MFVWPAYESAQSCAFLSCSSFTGDQPWEWLTYNTYSYAHLGWRLLLFVWLLAEVRKLRRPLGAPSMRGSSTTGLATLSGKQSHSLLLPLAGSKVVLSWVSWQIGRGCSQLQSRAAISSSLDESCKKQSDDASQSEALQAMCKWRALMLLKRGIQQRPLFLRLLACRGSDPIGGRREY